MLTALGVPGIHNALVFIGLEVVPGINLTPWLFIVTSPALFMAVVDLQSLDTISRARHQLMEQNRSAFLLVDVKGRVLDFNNRFLQLAGIEAVAQMPLASLSLPEPFAVRLLKPKERNELRVPLHCAEWPDLRYFDIQTIPVRDEKGELGAYLHVWEDVTSRVKDFEERQLIRQEERLLRDLHDGVGGLLAKIAMLTEELSGSDVTVNYVRQLAREGTAEVRALMNSAERRQLTWPDIVAEIRRYGQLLFDEQVDFEFRMTGNPPDAFLPLASSMSLYRVCREAMHNVARHARARNVLFTLGFMPDRLTIAICDDGLGMSADAQPGRGLGNMRKRIEELGGEFNMEADQGFTINLWIPLPLQDLMAVEVA
jgi:signal transduction histidine kinase